MATGQSTDYRLKIAEERIQWVLDHPGMSGWVKGALREARDRNPVDVLNDLEILNQLLRPHAEALVDSKLFGKGNGNEEDASGFSNHK